MGCGRGRPERTACASGGRGGLGLGVDPGCRGVRRICVALLGALDAAGCVDELGLAREERVAVGADFEAELVFRALSLPRGSARTVDVDLVVLGVDLFLHGPLLHGFAAW